MNPDGKDNPFSDIGKLHHINRCIQCGTCSGSCPLSDRMDHAPRELFALIREGAYDEALRSNTPWFCVSCYACMVRCPKEIPVTDLMYAFKEKAREQGTVPKNTDMPDLYDAFSKTVKQFGRITESFLMGRYGLRHPLAVAKNAPLAVKMALRHRLELKPQTTADPSAFARLYALTEKKGDKP